MNGQISAEEAYRKIRAWYQANVQKVEERGDEYGEKSARLIRALPPVEAASRAEIQAVFMHVMTMYLEWAYVESDGEHQMHEYVRMAVGGDFYLSDSQKEELISSRLWPYLQTNS